MDIELNQIIQNHSLHFPLLIPHVTHSTLSLSLLLTSEKDRIQNIQNEQPNDYHRPNARIQNSSPNFNRQYVTQLATFEGYNILRAARVKVVGSLSLGNGNRLNL